MWFHADAFITEIPIMIATAATAAISLLFIFTVSWCFVRRDCLISLFTIYNALTMPGGGLYKLLYYYSAVQKIIVVSGNVFLFGAS